MPPFNRPLQRQQRFKSNVPVDRLQPEPALFRAQLLQVAAFFMPASCSRFTGSINNCDRVLPSLVFTGRFPNLRLSFIQEAITVYPRSIILRDNPMRAQHFNNAGFAHRHVTASQPAQHSGWITELRYSEQPGMMQILLSTAAQAAQSESRWHLWLTPAHKLNRAWLQQSGLPLKKSMHVADSERCTSVEAMIKALRTGN
ncbi:SulA-like leucine-rich domain-containing protein [Candidatus Pantoea persica]|uniref:SulA-like leucine-rich domain-containing protein n=1 Tax=Candidatus Pantoea persica TaxID=2518128 RepID=UPI00215DADAD|nr:SulA-like leucine-rich domain-containing protein [Candidatus Pantoea persica]